MQLMLHCLFNVLRNRCVRGRSVGSAGLHLEPRPLGPNENNSFSLFWVGFFFVFFLVKFE